MLDEPTMSDQTLLLSVEDLINLAMGPVAGNTVDFKMVKTILHILARQMRLLEQKVILEVGELPVPVALHPGKGRDQETSQSTSSDSKGKDGRFKKKHMIDNIQEEPDMRRDQSHFTGEAGSPGRRYGIYESESDGSADSDEREEREEEAQKAKEKARYLAVKAEREKERAEMEREKMEKMSPAEREQYQKELQKEQEQREKAEKLAEEEQERAEKEARAKKEKARAEKEKAKAEKERLRIEKEKEIAEKEREIAEREMAKMEKMSPSEKKEYMKQLEKEKEERRKAVQMAQEEEERVEKEKARAERETARAEKEKERAEREREKMEKMSPREREKYEKELEKDKIEREEERKKLEKMDYKEREQYEKAQYKERERVRFEQMSPNERELYEQELQKKKDEKERAKMEKMSPKEREQYEEEKERVLKEKAKVEKMSPKEREKYEKEQQKEIAIKEKAKIEKMSPKEREKYEKEQQKEKEKSDSDKSQKEKAKLEKMSPKEREKYEKEQKKELAEKEKAKMEKMSPKEREKYEKEQQKEKEKAEKEKAKIEKMSPKEREKYEKEQQKEKEKSDSDKSQKEKAKLEKMSPKEREKYEKEQQKEKEKAEKQAQKELEKEKAKMDKMSPQEREKYVKEKEKTEKEAREKARLEDSAKLGEVVESISEKYDAKLKEKVLVVEKGSSGRGSELGRRRSSIEVVTRSQFALLEAAVASLKENTGPLPPLTLPENEQLRSDLAKGNLSLTDAMMAMQVSARVQAAEQAIGRLGGVLTQLAGQGVIPETERRARDEDGDFEARATKAHGKASPSVTSHKSVQLKEPGQELATRPSRASAAPGAARSSIVSKGPSSMALTQYEMDAALEALRKELMEKVNAITSRALTSAETTSNLAKSVVEKMDVALKIDDRISTLNALVSDYTEQLAGFDAGLTTQMQSFREQIMQMRGDLTAGLALLESANNNAETAAMMELTERYEELVNGLDNTLLAHQALATFQDQLNLDFRSLLESVEMLREQKADRDEVIDGLRDKADNERLAGLLREDDFNQARADLDERLAVCHDKFRKQDAVWVAALKELTAVVQRKAEHTDLMKTRQETTQQLQEIDEKIKRLALILGEPKAAILTRKLAKDALCAACLAPALMDPEDPTSGKPFLLPAALPHRTPAQRGVPVGAEEPCVPEWKPPESPDLRTHTCHRWVGGSHTLLSAATRGHCEAPAAPPAAMHKFVGQGDDGRLYMMESELQPCEECNPPPHCSEGGP